MKICADSSLFLQIGREDGTKVGFDYKKRLKMILHPVPKEEEKEKGKDKK